MKVRPQAAGLTLAALAGILLLSDGQADPSKPLAIPYQVTHTLNYAAAPSPDGKRLVSVTVIAGRGQLFVMDSDGSNATQITHDAADYDDPIWSPDGTKILMTSNMKGHERIYTVNPDGTGLEPLTPDSIRAIHAGWSADGTRVVYCTDDDVAPPAKNDTATYSIDVRTRRIVTLVSGGINTYPTLSPD